MPFRIEHVSGFSKLSVFAETADEALDAVYRVLGEKSLDDVSVSRDGIQISLAELTRMAMSDDPLSPA